MSVGPIVDAIGVVGSLLTTIGFAQANWGSTHPEGATVRIKAGLPDLDKEGDSLGGSINHVYAFDVRNGYAGQADGCHIDSGGICDMTIDQPVSGRRAGYISISNDNDATCIAWVTVQQFDGTRSGAWTGDVGYACGQTWYNSVEVAGTLSEEQGGGNYIPKCTWLDGDHTNDIANAALKFDTLAYGENVKDTAGKNACGPTIYGSENEPIADKPASAKRNTRVRPTWMKNQLVMSNHTSQPAEELCTSATSWGPDFIGSDAKFCDMESKKLSPLCSSQNVDGCLDINEGGGQLMKRMKVARRDTSVVHKSYKKVHKWGH
ncbi:hypothetical protein K505DRAFT_360120 [Melanomma pulvis-pyrius CBS 109.77]|uniref:Uncharacterized protein n=1 Tax=Melanomma pulvis-pyrius CBS 109.77 TaxID=1314802 RepID=A0A6A6XGB6_9PLEO|nr:hypothetical protein K505DRAFT_360120 [Melanomma pulvis-pyrius CBS 109.77]